MTTQRLTSFAALLCAGLLGALLVHLFTPKTVQAQSADGGRRYVAVTGNYMEGVSLLYVLDQETQHLAVYEARGGASNSHRVQFVGARNIELDMQLDGYNDESDLTHQELEKEFLKSGIPVDQDGTKAGG
ncbi:MAG: hypothetical protein QF489_04715 [Planctomycetota bacterium]|jgi:hypothetical protein|nr:hypothetical protein [Planctomycetota bacterium]